MKRLIAVLVVAIIVVVTVIGVAGMSATKGFASEDLVAPEVEVVPRSSAQAPTPTTIVRQETDWGIEWSIADVYSGFGGVLWLSVNNNGPRNIWVYGMTFSWVGASTEYSRDAGTLAPPAQKTEVGILAFGAPVSAGTQQYEIWLEVAVQQVSGDAWYDYGEMRGGAHDIDVLAADGLEEWSTDKNPTYYYNEVNSLVSSKDAEQVADAVRSKYPGGYSILQVCEAYEWVRRNVAYVADTGDHWQSAKETLELRTGDCEDHAILVASIIKNLGGNARVNVIEAHAFPTVFVGGNGTDLEQLEGAIDSFYWTPPGTLRINYLIDDAGYWMVVDTVGIAYAGGLPAESRYATLPDGGSWTFTRSDYLITVDATGQTSKFLGIF